MREHEYTVELPHGSRRLWALFQRYDLWKEYAPAVLDVEIVYPGDADLPRVAVAVVDAHTTLHERSPIPRLIAAGRALRRRATRRERS